MRREGRPINHKKVQRLWREAGLSQPRKRKRRRRMGESVPVTATHMNHVWTYLSACQAGDFIHDRTEGGAPLRTCLCDGRQVLTVEDEHTCLPAGRPGRGWRCLSAVPAQAGRLIAASRRAG